MFEWKGGYIWCNDQESREKFDVGNIEDKLELSDKALKELERLSEWHDTALDWDNPGGPSPWPEGESKRFNIAALKALEIVKRELGSEFEVEYHEI